MKEPCRNVCRFAVEVEQKTVARLGDMLLDELTQLSLDNSKFGTAAYLAHAIASYRHLTNCLAYLERTGIDMASVREHLGKARDDELSNSLPELDDIFKDFTRGKPE